MDKSDNNHKHFVFKILNRSDFCRDDISNIILYIFLISFLGASSSYQIIYIGPLISRYNLMNKDSK